MEQILMRLGGLNISYVLNSHEFQVLDRTSWVQARKRLGKPYYITVNSAVYEMHNTRFVLLAPPGMLICE